jgi:hypothetical protein
MHKSATKCNETLGKWCKNKHGASKLIDTLETYQLFTSSTPHHQVPILKIMRLIIVALLVLSMFLPMMITVMRIVILVNLLLLRLFMWGVLILLCIWLMIGMFYVIVIVSIRFMLLLKVTMREGNMVWWISTILSFPSLCCKSWSCTCFIYPCLLLCA